MVLFSELIAFANCFNAVDRGPASQDVTSTDVWWVGYACRGREKRCHILLNRDLRERNCKNSHENRVIARLAQ
jgi:hypothetical protein